MKKKINVLGNVRYAHSEEKVDKEEDMCFHTLPTQKHEDNTPPMPEHTEQNNTTCLLCNITYKAKSGYHSHMRNKHPIVYQAPTRQPIKIMLNASLQSQSNLLRPQTTQSTSQQIPQQPNTAMTNQLQCRACQRICKSKAGYRPHQS